MHEYVYYIVLYILYSYVVVVVCKKYFSRSNIIMLISLIHILIIGVYVWDIRAAIYFCFILLCVSNILTQCMVCMYLISAYCCDTV